VELKRQLEASMQRVMELEESAGNSANNSEEVQVGIDARTLFSTFQNTENFEEIV
jgi:hypothetical protein